MPKILYKTSVGDYKITKFVMVFSLETFPPLGTRVSIAITLGAISTY